MSQTSTPPVPTSVGNNNAGTANPPSVPTPVGSQATGQVAQSSSVASPVAAGSLFGGTGIVSTSSTSTFVTSGTGIGNNVIYVNQGSSGWQQPRKPRRPKEKRQVPLFTAGLEAKLNKTLDKDATKILRFLTRKVGQHPKMESGVSEDIYEYSTMFQYAIQTGVPWNNTQSLPPIQQHTVKFFARLVLRNDGTLREYEVRMGGAKT
jgi:hypothetical protein